MTGSEMFLRISRYDCSQMWGQCTDSALLFADPPKLFILAKYSPRIRWLVHKIMFNTVISFDVFCMIRFCI